MDMSSSPEFPPLLSGQAVRGATDPFDKARALAVTGCDAGLVVYNLSGPSLRAAIVFVPEVALVSAMAMLPVCGIGFQNALGALAPPEVAVQLSWDGKIHVNGARCGSLRVAADTGTPDAIPAWLVVGLDVPFEIAQTDPGQSPETTALFEEGCVEIAPQRLLESWTRHTLVWINRWSESGPAPIHREWMGLLRDVGEEVTQGDHSGSFVGTDENLGMLLRADGTTHLIPLTTLLENA